ncbi:lytic transglycosylase domain-containing protein [Thermomonas aquatica]|mgnify:CR=1 FL=1|jgi:soluble lytic murein transglycosylase-like protein|uniref:Lytic transglycosylase domain-containing protein n=1 Tax=Thermomonas aquatica TaxID=2202149 RepID=A0A5B7ZSC2_9GAMM|nr:lytic transglycosylase domain-containing protein [Thermomonas aquatica]QDA58071.1 lytic transglycosylase domain-containing protein [Thermomonas aquatica]
MRGSAAFLLLLSALALPVMAGNVYRCDAGDGVTSYSNKRVPGASCRLVGSYKAQRPAKPRPKPAATVASAGAAANEPQTLPKGVAMGVPPATIISPPPAKAAPASAPVAAASYNAPRLIRGQVYAYVGKDGVRNYSSARPRGVSASAMRTIKYSYMETCYACAAKPGVNFGTLRLNTAAYQAEIAAAAREHGVDEAIVRAIIHAESAYNPLALSRVGAQGLMQLMPATARRFGVSDAFNPQQNIQGGVKYLAWLLKRFNGNLSLAAAGYNAGEGAVDKYNGVPPYSETRRYVDRVGVLAERYRGSLAAAR